MLLKLDVKQAHLERIYRRMSYKKKSRFAKLSRYEDNFQCWFPRDIGFLHNNPFAPPVPRGIWQRRGIRGEGGGARGYCGHLSSSASRRPDTRQRTLLNQLKLCRPRGVADLSSRYESGKDGANTRVRKVDEGEWEKGRKFNSRRNEGWGKRKRKHKPVRSSVAHEGGTLRPSDVIL